MKTRLINVVLLVAALLGTAWLLRSPGTTDMGFWTGWAEHTEEFGIFHGFQQNFADYPPLTTAILGVALKIARLLGYGTFGAIKGAILGSLVLASALVYARTRRLGAAAGFHLSLLVSGLGLGYVDAFFAPPLIAALWALEKRRLATASVLLACATLTKWQPLLILPFALAYALAPIDGAGKRLPRVARIVLPGLGVLLVVAVAFGVTSTIHAFLLSLSHKSYSAFALNANWITTHILHVVRPEIYGPLAGGLADIIDPDPSALTIVPRIAAFVLYAVTFIAFVRVRSSFEDFLRHAIAGYMCFLMFNIGMHENHWFLPEALGLYLLAVTHRNRLEAFFLVAAANINLVLFYGIHGTPPIGLRSAGGRFDLALPFAIVNVLAFGAFWIIHVRRAFGRRSGGAGVAAA